jgi:hypothetical protein
MSRNVVAYDDDFFAWTQEQARPLRAGEFARPDAANVAEEVEDRVGSIRHELRNRLAVLTMHLLEWQYQPGHRSPSRSGTINEQREQIGDLLEESPSLRPLIMQEAAKTYRRAVKKAAVDTGFPENAFPPQCPFTLEQVLPEQFYPGD